MQRTATLLFLFSVFFTFSCNKFTEVDAPPGHQTTDMVFTSDSTAIEAMKSVPRKMMGAASILNGNNTRYIGYYGLEFFKQNPIAQEIAFVQRQLNHDDQMVFLTWQNCYDYISACNRIIINVRSSTTITLATKQLLTGEAKFFRSLCFFYLVNLYGGVPIPTETDYVFNTTLKRATVPDVYGQIIADLKDAASLLPERDLAGDVLPYRRVRPNKWAALGLLSRVYLYAKLWSEAEKAATDVINSGLFRLEDSVQYVFQAASTETVFQLQTVGGSSAESNYFAAMAGQQPAMQPTKQLVDSYQDTDSRKLHWFMSYKVNGIDYYSITKYKRPKQAPNALQYAVVLRLAEQYLNRAEARIRLGNTTGATEDLNQLRTRALISRIPASSSTALLTLLPGERQRELFAEGGLYFFDIKRWYLEAIFDSPLYQAAQKNLGTHPQLEVWRLQWPIPQNEIRLDTNLHQNDGY